jgi:hypothetical protein
LEHADQLPLAEDMRRRLRKIDPLDWQPGFIEETLRRTGWFRGVTRVGKDFALSRRNTEISVSFAELEELRDCTESLLEPTTH